MSKVSTVGIFGFFLSLVGGGLLGASMGTEYWFYSGILNSGLFRSCVSSTICVNIGWDSAAGLTVWTTRGLLFTACLLILFGYILATATMCGSMKMTGAGVCIIIGSIATLVGAACYTGLTYTSTLNGISVGNVFGYSFYLAWSSGAVLLIAGIIMVNGNKKSTQVTPVPDQMQQMVWNANIPLTDMQRQIIQRGGTITYIS